MTTYIVPQSVGVADRALGGGRGASTLRCGGGGGGSSSYLSSCCSIRWCLGLGTGCLRTTDEGWLNHAVTVAPWDRGGGRGRVADCGGAALINESAKRKEQLQVFMDDGRVEEEASPGHPMHRTHNPIRTFPSSELKHTRLSPAQGRARTSSRKTSQRRRRGRPKPQTESLGQRRYAHSAPPHPPPDDDANASRVGHQRQPRGDHSHGAWSASVSSPSRSAARTRTPPSGRRVFCGLSNHLRSGGEQRPPRRRYEWFTTAGLQWRGGSGSGSGGTRGSNGGTPPWQPGVAARVRGRRQPRRSAKARPHHTNVVAAANAITAVVSPASTAGRRQPPVAPPAVADMAALRSLPAASPALTTPRRNPHHPGAATPASTAAEIAAHDTGLVSSWPWRERTTGAVEEGGGAGRHRCHRRRRCRHGRCRCHSQPPPPPPAGAPPIGCQTMSSPSPARPRRWPPSPLARWLRRQAQPRPAIVDNIAPPVPHQSRRFSHGVEEGPQRHQPPPRAPRCCRRRPRPPSEG